MSNVPNMEELLAAGVHFGHQSSRWHPKMKPFIYGVRGGVHITNLDETVRLLPQALDFLSGIAARGGSVLFVGTKPQARELVKAAAESCGQPYVHNRWLGGTMTNFAEIKRLIKKFVDLKDKQAKGELAKYTKQEQVWFARDIEDMDRKVGGIQTMMTTPDAIVIIDIKAEKTALMEAKQKNVPVVAIVDTNVNPDQVDYPIPGNDDGIKSIGLMLTLMAEAINEGKASAVKIAAAAKAAKDEEADTKVKAEAVAAVEELDEKIAEELATKKMEEKVSA